MGGWHCVPVHMYRRHPLLSEGTSYHIGHIVLRSTELFHLRDCRHSQAAVRSPAADSSTCFAGGVCSSARLSVTSDALGASNDFRPVQFPSTGVCEAACTDAHCEADFDTLVGVLETRGGLGDTLEALLLVDDLLSRCPLSGDWAALPHLRSVLHQLLGSSEDDDRGRGRGSSVRGRAASLLTRVLDSERKQLPAEDVVRRKGSRCPVPLPV